MSTASLKQSALAPGGLAGYSFTPNRSGNPSRGARQPLKVSGYEKEEPPLDDLPQTRLVVQAYTYYQIPRHRSEF